MRILKALLLLFLGVVLFSCNKEDATVDPFYKVPYDVQYKKDQAAIDKFLDEYTMNDSFEFTALAAPIDVSQTIRVKYADKLRYKMIKSDGVEYKVYYITLNDGVANQPTKVDSALVTYKGVLLNKRKDYVDTKSFNDNQFFDQASEPVWMQLGSTVKGFGEIMSMFKAGTPTPNTATNEVSFAGFGEGVMFLPSGLGYYEKTQTKSRIPAYSPLIFSFNLKSMNYADSDFDGIDSKDEEFEYALNPTFGVWEWVAQKRDTDKDGKKDYKDNDDDGDARLTKYEIKYTYDDNGVTKTAFYPFNGAAVDDPATAIDETKGIPDCSGDYVSPTRKRKHLDNKCR